MRFKRLNSTSAEDVKPLVKVKRSVVKVKQVRRGTVSRSNWRRLAAGSATPPYVSNRFNNELSRDRETINCEAWRLRARDSYLRRALCIAGSR